MNYLLCVTPRKHDSTEVIHPRLLRAVQWQGPGVSGSGCCFYTPLARVDAFSHRCCGDSCVVHDGVWLWADFMPNPRLGPVSPPLRQGAKPKCCCSRGAATVWCICAGEGQCGSLGVERCTHLHVRCCAVRSMAACVRGSSYFTNGCVPFVNVVALRLARPRSINLLGMLRSMSSCVVTTVRGVSPLLARTMLHWRFTFRGCGVTRCQVQFLRMGRRAQERRTQCTASDKSPSCGELCRAQQNTSSTPSKSVQPL